MELSLCITTFERAELTMESFSKVYDSPIIGEVIIVDDCSDINTYEKLSSLIRSYEVNKANPKIKLFRNEVNLGMSGNKKEAISKAKNEWCIILDSDNVLPVSYLEALYRLGSNFNPQIIYHPEFAEPDFDFSRLPDWIGKANAKHLLHLKEFRIFLNTSNYVVNRDEYLRIYEYDEAIRESDTIYFAHLWLAAGNAFYIVKGMRYYHRKHDGSGWLRGDHEYNLQKAAEIQEKIKQL